MTDNNELRQGVEQALEQRATQVLNADPQWQRLGCIGITVSEEGIGDVVAAVMDLF